MLSGNAQEVNTKGQKPFDTISHKKKLRDWYQVKHHLCHVDGRYCALSIAFLDAISVSLSY